MNLNSAKDMIYDFAGLKTNTPGITIATEPEAIDDDAIEAVEEPPEKKTKSANCGDDIFEAALNAADIILLGEPIPSENAGGGDYDLHLQGWSFNSASAMSLSPGNPMQGSFPSFDPMISSCTNNSESLPIPSIFPLNDCQYDFNLKFVKDSKTNFWIEYDHYTQVQKDKDIQVQIGNFPYPNDKLLVAIVRDIPGRQPIRHADKEVTVNEPKGNAVFDVKPPNKSSVVNYQKFEMPKYGIFTGAILEMKNYNNFWIKFNTLGTDSQNGGKKKENKTWKMIVFPLMDEDLELRRSMDDPLGIIRLEHNHQQLIDDDSMSIKIQVVVQPRKPKKQETLIEPEEFLASIEKLNVSQDKKNSLKISFQQILEN